MIPRTYGIGHVLNYNKTALVLISSLLISGGKRSRERPPSKICFKQVVIYSGKSFFRPLGPGCLRLYKSSILICNWKRQILQYSNMFPIAKQFPQSKRRKRKAFCFLLRQSYIVKKTLEKNIFWLGLC